MRRASLLLSPTLALALLASACPAVGPEPPDGPRVPVVIALDDVVAEVDRRFLSFAVDSSQVVGGDWWADITGDDDGEVDPYDFTRPALRKLTAELAPALLRIGGSEADKIFYALDDGAPSEPPGAYELVLTRAQLDAVCDFAVDLGLDLLFTLNAGPGPRDEELSWSPDNARALIEHVRARDCPVVVWELGNEINGFQAIHGTDFRIDGEQYAEDVATARALVDDVAPDSALAGPSSAFWPHWGELAPVMPEFMALGGEHLDIVTWHYYPQQSERCPVQSQRSSLYGLLDPAALDEVATWAAHVEALRDEHAPNASVWLGETGHAQCGGVAGQSDRFVTGFWWLDELGQMARRGQPMVVRQTLSGGNYQIIDEETLAPAPDYFSSLLHKRLMGTRVLDVLVEEDPFVRAYAHCARDTPGGVSVVALNLADEPRVLGFEGLPPQVRHDYVLTADELTSKTMRLNGQELHAPDGEVSPLPPAVIDAREHAPWLELPAFSYGFVVFPEADAPACR